MYALVQSASVRQLLIDQVPVLILSIVIAELFYKFRSFTLECIAFLVTWYLLDFAKNQVTSMWGKYG